MTELDMVAPGPSPSRRKLHVIFLIDCSGSMAGDKIEALNHAVRSIIPEMRNAARENPSVDVELRVIRFGDDASWWQTGAPIPAEEFAWVNLQAGGRTSMGRALALVAQELNPENMPGRILPPILILISDGQPTDSFGDGLRSLMAAPYGKKAVRVSIAIGSDVDLEPLRRFIGNAEIEPLEAHNAASLVDQIRWVTTALLQRASAPIAPGAQSWVIPPPPREESGPIIW